MHSTAAKGSDQPITNHSNNIMERSSPSPDFPLVTTWIEERPTEALLICLGLLLVSASYWIRRDQSACKRKIPRSKHGFFQTTKRLGSDNAPFFLLDNVKETGSRVFQLNLPVSRGFFVVGDLSLAREVLTDATSEKAGYFAGKKGKLSRTITIASSFTSSAHWRYMRKGTAPAFSSNQVRRMNQVCRMHVEQWIKQKQAESEATNGVVIEPSVEMTRLTTKIICEAAFEYKITEQETTDFLYHIEIALREFAGRQIFDPFRRVYGSWTPAGRRAEASGAWIRGFARKILTFYRQSRAGAGSSAASDNIKSVVRLIDENKHLTDEQRVGEILIFLLGGYDTTGYTLSNALVALAENPGVAKKLQTELYLAEEQKHDGKETTLDASWRDCNYLHYFIRENFRVVPVAALGSLRKLGRDLEVPESVLLDSETSLTGEKTAVSGTNAVIPAGAPILMPQMIFNRNEKIFPNPERFDPDRWAKATPDMNASLMTFSLGSRNCIGQSLASAEIQSVIPRLARQFDFSVERRGSPQCFLTFKMGDYQLRMKNAPSNSIES